MHIKKVRWRTPSYEISSCVTEELLCVYWTSEDLSALTQPCIQKKCLVLRITYAGELQYVSKIADQITRIHDEFGSVPFNARQIREYISEILVLNVPPYIVKDWLSERETLLRLRKEEVEDYLRDHNYAIANTPRMRQMIIPFYPTLETLEWETYPRVR